MRFGIPISVTFAGRDEKVAAVADVAEVQVDHGSRMSAAGERDLSQVVGSHCCRVSMCVYVYLSISTPASLILECFFECSDRYV